MSEGIYAPDKALFYGSRMDQLRRGEQPYPVHVQIIPSDLCNQNCSFCAYRSEGYTSSELFHENGNYNPNRKIPREKLLEIIRDCKEMGVEALQYTGGGEATLHPNLDEAMRLSRSLGIKTAIVTNGVLFEEKDLWDSLLDCEWVRISIDAGSKKSYAAIRRCPQSHWDKVWTNISKLVRLRGEKKSPVIGLGFVVTKENHKEIKDFILKAKDAGVDNVRLSGVFQNDGGAYFDSFYLEAKSLIDEAKMLQDDSFKVIDRFVEKVSDLDEGSPKHPFCGYMHFTTFIGGDCSLYRCCVTSYNPQGFLGSLKDMSFKDLWDSQSKKDKMKSFDATSCTRCQFNDKNRSILNAISRPEHVEFV